MYLCLKSLKYDFEPKYYFKDLTRVIEGHDGYGMEAEHKARLLGREVRILDQRKDLTDDIRKSMEMRLASLLYSEYDKSKSKKDIESICSVYVPVEGIYQKAIAMAPLDQTFYSWEVASHSASKSQVTSGGSVPLMSDVGVSSAPSSSAFTAAGAANQASASESQTADLNDRKNSRTVRAKAKIKQLGRSALARISRRGDRKHLQA